MNTQDAWSLSRKWQEDPWISMDFLLLWPANSRYVTPLLFFRQPWLPSVSPSAVFLFPPSFDFLLMRFPSYQRPTFFPLTSHELILMISCRFWIPQRKLNALCFVSIRTAQGMYNLLLPSCNTRAIMLLDRGILNGVFNWFVVLFMGPCVRWEQFKRAIIWLLLKTGMSL